MQIPSSILKKMALGAGGLALTAGAVSAVTAGNSGPGAGTVAPADAAPMATPSPTPTPTATPKPPARPKVPRTYDPCPPCGRG